ncbi:hypothetical protein [Ureibacillus sinduriensis]|uniref:BioF2-like acetyltransferase domain-containing protein n=1 Tax=Ureibacillus sinduriensis BLB-1 = JCM 15800 TaxID=1384057 RepID=A0A0A3HVJ4_9BACL|nr:hypothetical protein [Ureibacillus sinduriensis]KGR76641.1 hypothetical protein CD33_05625 [Ureibacillus sinduriensis BLB-1 = JCM 15800]
MSKVPSKSRAKLYGKDDMAELDWSFYENGAFLKEYFDEFITDTTAYMKNVDTEIFLAAIGRKLIPCTVNEAEYNNSYVCSPYTHYITYAKEELRFISPKALRTLLAAIINIFGSFAKSIEINKIVYINNYCLSTNLVSALSKREIRALRNLLTEQFPKYQLGFRSINAITHKDMMVSFEEEGFELLPSRYIYISTYDRLNTPTKSERKKRRQDEKGLTEGMTIVTNKDLATEDIGRIVELYNQLYIEKYSVLNPQFTYKFIEKLLDKDLFLFQGIKINGRLEAISGTFVLNNMMTNPIYGYNLSLFPQHQLYRILRHLNTRLALDNQYLYHQSAGAGNFKKARSGEGTPEYTALYVGHLPFHKKYFWKLLSLLLKKIGIPLVEKLEL